MSGYPKYGELEVREEVIRLNTYLRTHKISTKRFDIRHGQDGMPKCTDQESRGDEILGSIQASAEHDQGSQGGTLNPIPCSEEKTPQSITHFDGWQLYIIDDETKPTLGRNISASMSAEQLYHTVHAIIAFLIAIKAEV